jgi:DNA-binding CsgD family transcriptional regulator
MLQTAARPGKSRPPLDAGHFSHASALFAFEDSAWRPANPEAETLQTRYGWIALRNGRLNFMHQATNDLFRARASQLSDPSSSSNTAPKRMPIIIRDIDGVPAGVVLLFSEPAPSQPGAPAASSSLIFAVVLPEDRRRREQTIALVDLGNLTQAEGTLIHELLAGYTVQQIALKSDRSIPTVRWHIKNILGKLGVSRIDDLFRIAGLLP